jgi:hypothetical protein
MDRRRDTRFLHRPDHRDGSIRFGLEPPNGAESQGLGNLRLLGTTALVYPRDPLLKHHADHPATIPLAVLRLISLSKSLASAELVFDYATTECFTQGEMCYSIISATIPCLRIFMHSAKTGLLGMATFDSTGDRSKASYLGSRSGNFASTSRSQDRSKAKKRTIKVVDEDIIELQDRRLGETHTSAMAGSDKQSVTSDSSERAIIVRQTVDVVYT